jgi:hypothetical protein
MAIADLIEAAMRAFGMYVLTLYRKMRDIT